jgi:hypothetical protein
VTVTPGPKNFALTVEATVGGAGVGVGDGVGAAAANLVGTPRTVYVACPAGHARASSGRVTTSRLPWIRGDTTAVPAGR